jgi:hypothetical protein
MFDFKKAIPFTNLYINKVYSNQYQEWEESQKRISWKIAQGKKQVNDKEFDAEKQFITHLEETYSFQQVGGPFQFMSPATVLKEIDPVAYDQDMNDWLDYQDELVEENETYWRKEDYTEACNIHDDEMKEYIEYLQEQIIDHIESVDEDYEFLERILDYIENQ